MIITVDCGAYTIWLADNISRYSLQWKWLQAPTLIPPLFLFLSFFALSLYYCMFCSLFLSRTDLPASSQEHALPCVDSDDERLDLLLEAHAEQWHEFLQAFGIFTMKKKYFPLVCPLPFLHSMLVNQRVVLNQEC